MPNIKEEFIDFNNCAIHSELIQVEHYHAHYHSDAIEIIYVLDGTITLQSSESQTILNKNDTFAIDYGDIHYYFSDTDNLVLITHIEPINVPPHIIKTSFFSFEGQSIMDFQVNAMNTIKELLLTNAILDSDNKKNADTQKNISIKIMELLLNHFDWMSFVWNPDDPLGSSQERIRRIMNYCHEHSEDKVSVSEIAELEHVNENYFSVLMQKTSFGSFSNLMSYTRCYKAEHLLLTTDMKVTDISFEVGFSDPKYFFSAFKKNWECTPSQFRKKYKELENVPDSKEVIFDPERKQLISQFICDYFIEDSIRENIGQFS